MMTNFHKHMQHATRASYADRFDFSNCKTDILAVLLLPVRVLIEYCWSRY